MKESESIKLLKERSAGDNIFDAERQVFSKNSDGMEWNKKISDKRDVCKSDIKTKEKIC